jgi:hypothetical protein
LEWNFRGQLSGWIRETKIRGEWENFSGLLYIPEVNLIHDLKENKALDAEISLSGFTTTGTGPFEDETDLDIYRASGRYTTTQSEIRLGLQKINFGPARLLRPLRWFDQLNPTDPLQLTEGVYALRYRYDTLNNANFRLWGLYGNDDPKGFELLPTATDTLEGGGRIQYPMLGGDLGVTFHLRKVDGTLLKLPDFRENRYALDGRWDVGIGVWFETTLQQQKSSYFTHDWTKRSVLGLDYTFNIGNGLYLLIEHMGIALSDKAYGWDEDFHTSAYSMNYPVGMMDTFMAIGYYSWDQHDYYQYLNWKRTYDSLVISVSFFSFPETPGKITGTISSNARIGSGGEIMVIFNH